MNGKYGDIYKTPAYIYLNATYPSPDYSTASGSGTVKAIIGRKENLYLQVLDIYANMYSSDKYKGELVYRTYVKVNGNQIVPVNLTKSTNSSNIFLKHNLYSWNVPICVSAAWKFLISVMLR